MKTARQPATSRSPAKPRFALRPSRALEHQEQTALFNFAKIQARRDPRWCYLFAIPNGTAASSMAEAVRAKKTGRKRGVPDIFLPVPVVREIRRDPDGTVYREQFAGLFIELKRKGGTSSDVSDEQREWLDKLAAQGYRATVAYGWDEAVAVIQAYLSLTTPVTAP